MFSKWPEDAQKRFEEKFDKLSYHLVDAQRSSGYMYIRNLVFMNGGALVAILSSRAGLISSKLNVDWTFWPMVCFFIGLTLAVALNGFVYLRHIYIAPKIVDIHEQFIDGKISTHKFEASKEEITETQWYPIMLEIVMGAIGLLCFVGGSILGILGVFSRPS